MRFSLILPPVPQLDEQDPAPAGGQPFDDESPTERFSRDELPVWDADDAT